MQSPLRVAIKWLEGGETSPPSNKPPSVAYFALELAAGVVEDPDEEAAAELDGFSGGGLLPPQAASDTGTATIAARTTRIAIFFMTDFLLH